MANTIRRVLIVGASAAGLSAAEVLRRAKYDGEIMLLGDELHPPYDRPPLSKQVLGGTWDAARTHLRPQGIIDSLDAEWVLGSKAVHLDTAGHLVHTENGSIEYDALIIATGVSPRRLPFDSGIDGICVLKTLDDALHLRTELGKARTLVVIGAGFLGTEIASSAVSMGVDVHVVDPLERPMARQLDRAVGDRITALHEGNRVNMHLGVGVSGFASQADRVSGVELTDGRVLPADVVVVAIGSTPNTAWLERSSLKIEDGVVCDEFCRADDDVYAIGDVARWHHPGLGRSIRIEHRTNATEQAAAAVRSLLDDEPQPFAPVPYFWTDQYDVKIQAHGFVNEFDEVEVVAGDIHDERFALVYRAGGRVRGVLTWGLPRDSIRLRPLVVEGLGTP